MDPIHPKARSSFKFQIIDKKIWNHLPEMPRLRTSKHQEQNRRFIRGIQIHHEHEEDEE